MMLLIFLLVFLMLKLFPETAMGLWLHQHIVVRLVDIFAKLERKHVLFLIIGLFLIQGFATVATADVAILAAWDITVYLDVVAAVWTMTALTRTNSFWNEVKAWLAVILPVRKSQAAREVRSKSSEKSKHIASNDDERTRPLASAA
jgi:hypothetical protein